MSQSGDMTARLLDEIPKRFPGIRCWRQNTGKGVGWSVVKAAVGMILAGQIRKGVAMLSRPIMFGIVGQGDIGGQVAPHGRALNIEIKAGRDKQSDDQKGFQYMCCQLGSIYLVCRDVDVTLDELAVLYRGEGN